MCVKAYMYTLDGVILCDGCKLASSLGSLLKNGGRREPGNIREKSCRFQVRHHSCDLHNGLPMTGRGKTSLLPRTWKKKTITEWYNGNSTRMGGI